MRLCHAVEDNADFYLFASADVDALVLTVVKTAIVCQFLIRVLDTDAPFFGFEIPKMALFAKALDERTDGFILCQLEAADLFLSTNVDVDFSLHFALAVTLWQTSPQAYQPVSVNRPILASLKHSLLVDGWD